MSSTRQIKELNAEQKVIVEAIPKSSNFVHSIVAGAGVGKTFVLVYLVEEILKQEPNSRILFLSFSRNARKVLQSRLGYVSQGSIDIRTFASFYLGVVYSCAGKRVPDRACMRLGYESLVIPKRFHLLTDDKEIIRILINTGIVRNKKDANTFLAAYKRLAWNKSLNEDQTEKLAHYAKYKSEKALFDFVDIEIIGHMLIKKGVFCLPRYGHIICDEAQDLKPLNIRTVDKMRGDTRLVFAGDPLQNIYGFQGACRDLENVLKQRFGEIQLYPLTISYRCTPRTAKVATNVAACLKKSKHHPLRTPEAVEAKGKVPVLISSPGWEALDECVEIVIKKTQIGYSYEDIVFLFRMFEHPEYQAYLRKLTGLLTKAEIPHYTKKDLDAYLYVAELLYSVMFFASKNARAMNMICDFHDLHKNKASTPCFEQFILEIEAGSQGSNSGERVDRALKLINSIDPTINVILEDINNKVLVTMMTSDFGLENYLTELEVLYSREKIYLGTIHSLKGGERDIVFIVGVNDTKFPLKEPSYVLDRTNDIRLLYTAITRSKKEIYFINCKSFRQNASPFLKKSITRKQLREWKMGYASTNKGVSNISLPVYGEDILPTC
ncbi:MAG: UvrD-helicase domain-containing protein [Oligoflexales bacterium]